MTETLPEWVNAVQLRWLDERIARLDQIIAVNKKIAEAEQQTPGPLVTGRSNYKLGKKLDAENERRGRAFARQQDAEGRRHRLAAIREGYLKGTCHYNGQPRRPGAAAARKQSAFNGQMQRAADGFDVRKIHRDLSIDGSSKLADGRVVSYHMNFDAEPPHGGYRYQVTHPDGRVQHGTWMASISRLQQSGELRKLLKDL